MNKSSKSTIKLATLFQALTLFVMAFSVNFSQAQSCDPNSLYDVIVSAYHQSVAQKSDGSWSGWGALMSNTGGSVLSPQDINVANYPALTGIPMLASTASAGSGSSEQSVLLTTTGLFAWGTEGVTIPNSITSNTTFQKITINSKTDGLPTGVSPSDVVSLVAINKNLIIRTQSGVAYILSANTSNATTAKLYGDGSTAIDNNWHQVKINSTTALTNIIALRGQVSSDTKGGFMALTYDGTNYKAFTWGMSVYKGDGSALTSFNYATQMSLPTGITPKMIAITGGTKTGSSGDNSFFVLSTSGDLYSLGKNDKKQLGDFTAIDKLSWVNVKKTASLNMTNVKFISAQEHDSGFPACGAITTTGDLYLWGQNGGNMLGSGPTADNALDPFLPGGFVSGTDIAKVLEIGGHTTVYLKENSAKFCYVGHKTAGSMGDGTPDDTNPYLFDCDATPVINICGSTGWDLGDAPVVYENGGGSNYAQHFYIENSTKVYLGGSGPVGNDDTPHSVIIATDNNSANGDGVEENGIASFPTILNTDTSYSFNVSLLNNSGLTANLYVWVDWNNNGKFEASEFKSTTAATSATSQTKTLSYTGLSSLTDGRRYVRVRLSTYTKTDDTATTNVDERSLGLLMDGEIEDYSLFITTSNPNPNIAPVTNDVTNTDNIPKTNGATDIDSFAGSDSDGTIVAYRIKTLPTKGTLYKQVGLDLVLISADEAMEVSTANGLKYDPSGTATGNDTFTYVAIDDDGFEDQTPATYTIRLSSPGVNISGSLSSFSVCAGATYVPQSFTVDGSALTADIVITAPTGYEISTTSGSGYSNTLSLTQTSGSVASTTIYVRLTASASGSPSGNLTVASIGITTQNIAVSGSVNDVPSVAIDETNTNICQGGSVTLNAVSNGASQIYGSAYGTTSTGPGLDQNWDVVALPQTFLASSNYLNLGVTLPYPAKVIYSGLPGIFVNGNGFVEGANTYYWIAPYPAGTSLQDGSYNWIVRQEFQVTETGTYDFNFTGAGDNDISFFIDGTIDTSSAELPTITGGTQIGATHNTFTSIGTMTGSVALTPGTHYAYMVMQDYGGLTCALISGADVTGQNTFAWSKKAASESTFTAISGANIASYTPTNITETTTYKVEINNGSCTSTSEVTVTVDPTSVAGTITGAASVCTGTNSTTLTLSGNTGSIQWQSSTDNSTFTDIVGETGSTYTATDLTATTYYRAVVTSGSCASVNTDSVTITVVPLPTVNAGTDFTICQGSTIQLNGSNTNGAIVWVVGGTGTISSTTIANPVYTPNAADIASGSVVFTMISNPPAPCAYVYDVVVVSILPISTPTADAGSATDTMCSTGQYQLEGTATNQASVLWTTSGTGSFSDVNSAIPTYTPSAADITAGTVTLTMTATGTADETCTALTATDSITITIYEPPTADAGDLSQTICSGFPATISGTATNGTIAWTTDGDGTFNTATIAAPIYTPGSGDIANGSVNLTITTTGLGGCVAASDSTSIQFTAAPTANAGTDTSICSTATFTTNGSATVGSTLAWSTSGTGTFANGNSLDAVYTPSAADITAGTVTLTLSANGAGACSSSSVTDTVVLTIDPAPTADAGVASAAICYGTTLSITGTSSNGTVAWTTTGTGSFDDATSNTPVYTPSSTDNNNTNVTLTMTVTGTAACAAASVSDSFVLTMSPPATANAGPATAHICAGSTYTLSGTATHGAIAWTTSGTGTFNNATIATPTYSPTAADITAGTVTLTMTVTGTGGCGVVSDSLVLTIFKVTATSTQTNVSCNGGSNGFASVTAANGVSPYTYSWSPSGGSLNEASGLAAGTYICTITDANGCTASPSITITQPQVLDATITKFDVTTNAGIDGSATVSATGGTTPYSYTWSPFGGSNATASNLSAGTYSCVISDSKGCSVTKSITISQPSAFLATTSQINILCNGLATGSATVVATGGSNVTYAWSPSGGNAATASNLTAGTYTCTITNGDGTVLTRTVTITQPSALTASTAQTNVLIYGNTTGAATVYTSGGTSPYTYAWSSLSATTSSVSNLAAGSYTCTITDANGCIITKAFTITQPALLAASTSATNVTCNGGENGSATISVTGGVTPYLYVWTPNVSTGATASNLAYGTYTCTVTDANGATLTRSFTITQPSLLTATTSQVNLLCNGATTGSASVVVSGGTTGYTYVWSPSGGTGATASNLSAGTYSCLITDANGCTLTKSFTITQPTQLVASTTQTNVAINGASTGSASVTVSGGTAAYTYAWSPSGGTNATASNLAAGSYTCTITDANGCSITKTFSITQPSAMVASTSQTNIACNGATTGSANVSVSGGAGSYTYLWAPVGGTTAAATNLAAGVYTCTITDANGALLVKTFTITQPTLLSASTTQTNVLINGNSTGSSTISVSGGVFPYTYVWSPSGGFVSTANGLSAGTYTVTATDSNACTITKTVTITQPAFALAATTSQTNVLCNGGSTGAAAVVASGGVGPYTYSWSPSVGTGANVTGLTAGTYVCTITDANGASIVKTFVITQPIALVASTSQTNVGCNGATSGSASVTVSGGASGYTYLWSPSGGTAATATNLSAGSYSCLITDANGCTLTKTFTITQPTALTSTNSQTNVAVNGASTGAASVTIAGGVTPYSYVWSPTGGTGATASNLTAGNYSVVVTDANGCSITRNFVLTQPTALTATTSQVNVVCYGGSTGSASVVASGGVAPYTYSWSPSGGIAATANNLAAGTYICTITDANGAINTKTVVITQNPLIPTPTADAGPVADSVCANSAFTTSAVASNGTIHWTTSGSGTFSNASNAITVYTPSAADSASGSVILTMTVTAPGTCNTPIAADSLNLTIYPVSNAGIISGATTVCSGTNSTTLTLSENTGSIQWQSSTDNSNFTNLVGQTAATYVANNLTQTTYFRTVVTSGVCSSATSSVATIAVSPSSVAGTISGASQVCFGSNSTTLTLTGNVGNVVWQSSTDDVVFTTIPSATGVTYTATNLTTTTYFRVAATSGVCNTANSASASIIVNPLPVSNAGPATAVICASTNYTTQGVAQNGAVTWNTSGTGTFASNASAVTVYTPSAADIAAGSVVLTMTVTGTATGCTSNTSSDSVTLTITAPIAPNAPTAQTFCSLNNPTVANLASPGSNIQWYAASNGGTALATTTALVNGTSYFATQTVGGCESITRTQVNVTLLCVINAVTDSFNLNNGYTGGSTPSVLSNDTLNGAILSPANVQLTAITVPSGFTLNANGTITVPAGTVAGSYQVVYKICEATNTTNCSQATATVVVVPPVILAVADNYGPINGFQGETTATVLANDILNIALVNPAEITLTAITLPASLVLNANGTITIPAGTPAGIYEVVYKITENLNPTNSSQVTAVVTVNPCLFFASNDCDGDGVTNGQEILDGTNPSDLCSMNYASQTIAPTAAWNQLDCDGDGVINGQEILDGTNPTGLCSFVVANQTVATNANWNNSDCDGDGVKNAIEVIDGTNPSDSCSFNYIHITNTPTSQWSSADCDGDGVTNGQEILDGTNPSDICSFNSGNLTVATSTAWNNADCDGDGVTNGQEISNGTDPQDLCSLVIASQTVATSTVWNNSDCDGDGVKNGQEITDGTDVLDVCSFDYTHQTLIPSNTWKNSDCDGDGVTNEQESQDGTNPQDSCSLVASSQTLTPTYAFSGSDCDGDGVTNGQEIIDGTDMLDPCQSNWENITVALAPAFLAGDCDGDGLTNGEEIGPNPLSPFDFDADGTPDYLEFNNADTSSEDELEIFNAVTPNGNGDNDIFVIRNIELYPDNTLTVFNRWGVKVYEVERYGLNGQVFKGTKAVGGSSGEDLPIGTYFYTLRYVNAQGVTKYRSGYLYLNR